MILSIEGEEATGKSVLALTAPLPILYLSLDMGSDRALYGTQFEKHFQGLDIVTVRYKLGEKPPEISGDIMVVKMPAPIQLDDSKLVGYMEQWKYFIELFTKAMMDDRTRTTVVDTMTLLRKNKCDAYLQELQEAGKVRKQLQQLEYSHPDGAIRTLYTFAESAGKNFIAVHHLRPHYVTKVGRDGVMESVPDGTLEIDGVRDTLRYVDVGIRQTKEKGNLKSTFIKCGPNLGYEGTTIPGLTWDGMVDMLSLGWHGEPYERRKEVVQEPPK